MGLRADLDWCGKSRPTGIRSPDRPARRQSLYRLRYPAVVAISDRKYLRNRKILAAKTRKFKRAGNIKEKDYTRN